MTKKRMRWGCGILITLMIIAFAVIILLLLMYDYRYGFRYQKKGFIDNQKNEPYALKIPLDEMDFDVYSEYFLMAETLNDPNFNRKIVLPCDVNYYVRKEDSKPAFTLKKGTEVYILPDRKAFSIVGYGLQCWPDYQEGWRYGCPFITEDTTNIVDGNTMYFVKSAQLERAAGAFYKANRKQLRYRCTPWDFPEIITQYVDRILYENGVFCPEWASG